MATRAALFVSLRETFGELMEHAGTLTTTQLAQLDDEFGEFVEEQREKEEK